MENQEITTEKPYKIQLPAFEGPLDLLLHLIKKQDVEITDIPISRLLNEYIEYIRLAQELNIDLAGEFLEMAAELAWIKSKMLLPEVPSEEDEGPDPRADLVARLLEYQQFKLAGTTLLNRPLLNREVFTREPVAFEEEATIEVDTLSLLSAFQGLLQRLPVEQFHEVHTQRLGVSERIIHITERLRGKSQVVFEDLFEGDRTRSDLVVTFLAVLEMAKQKLLKIIQEEVFHKIYVCPLFSESGE